jgi:sterol desaturase/sphingolipid hydroxylase (fatty acid hydroxylase superfamily)
MLDFIWDTKGYFFWLLMVSVLCIVLERIFTWRKNQKVLRVQIWQDYFWLIFNGHFAGVLLAYFTVWAAAQVNQLFGLINLPAPETLNLLSDSPLWLQFIVYFIFADFIEWLVHNMLHRIPWMWEFHKLHHSITELDWIGNFRFHWMEIIIYRSFKYLPLVILGINSQVILWIAIIATLIGHLNHSNIKTDWGILRYVFNSPRLHVWHHDVILHGKAGQNYAIVFSVWDWLFKTIYYPQDKESPDQLGFDTIESFPKGLFKRLFYPVTK